MTDPKEEVFLRVARIAARYDDHESIFWHEDLTVFANCSDVFAWATADCEQIAGLADVELFAKALGDCHEAADASYMGSALYAARKRGMRPQGAAYPKEPKLAALFDACGPPRELSIANPVGQS